MIDIIKKYSIYKLASLVMVFLCFIMMFLPWLSVSVNGLGMSMSEHGNLFDVSGGECFWTVMLSICELLFFVAIIVAVYGVVTDRGLLVAPVAGLAAFMFLMDLLTAAWTKGQVNEMFGGYGAYLSDLGVKVHVHAGIGVWLFLIFGVAAYAAVFYDARVAGKDPLDLAQLHFTRDDFAMIDLHKLNLPFVNGWTCSVCGADHRDNSDVCDACGAKRQEADEAEDTSRYEN